MFGSRVEKTIYLKGLCKIVVDHPLVDVDHVGLAELPDDAELASVPTGLVTIRFEPDELVKDQLREFAAGMVPLVLFRSDQLRSLNSEHSNTHFWQGDPEAELERYVKRVAVRDFSDFYEMVVRSRPLLQFIGAVSVKTARTSRHRRSVSR